MGKQIRYIIICVFPIILVEGCSTKQSLALPDQNERLEDSGKARVYVMRISKAVPVAGEIWDGETLIGSLGTDSYLCWEREPGEMVLRSGWFPALRPIGKKKEFFELRLQVEKGNVYYVMQQWRTGQELPTRLALLSEEYGRKKLAKCKPP